MVEETAVCRTSAIFHVFLREESDMKKLKAIITDLDRTLLRTDKSLSPYTVSVLKECKARGIKVMAATARPERSITEYDKAIGFDAVIASFAQGYDTLLGENGRGLSGGQKRMLGIARVFVRNRRFVVCDEPLAGLDVQSEQMVYTALERLLEGCTALLVSHREDIVHLADQVYFMEHGILK